jgi:hypothetical protein
MPLHYIRFFRYWTRYAHEIMQHFPLIDALQQTENQQLQPITLHASKNNTEKSIAYP